jgi:hypothetical protein
LLEIAFDFGQAHLGLLHRFAVAPQLLAAQSGQQRLLFGFQGHDALLELLELPRVLGRVAGALRGGGAGRFALGGLLVSLASRVGLALALLFRRGGSSIGFGGQGGSVVGVVAAEFPRAAVVHEQDARAQEIEEGAVVGNDDQGPGEFREHLLERRAGGQIEMVRRFVEGQPRRVREHQRSERQACTLASRESAGGGIDVIAAEQEARQVGADLQVGHLGKVAPQFRVWRSVEAHVARFLVEIATLGAVT